MAMAAVKFGQPAEAQNDRIHLPIMFHMDEATVSTNL